MGNLIEKLKLQGKLRDLKVEFVQVEGLLQDPLRDLREAKAVLVIGERAPFF